MTMGYHGILTATRFGYGAPRSCGEIYPSVVENCTHTHTPGELYATFMVHLGYGRNEPATK